MKSLRFGGKLKLFREERDLTVGEAAAMCGVAEKTWERIEAGENAPSSAHLVRMLKGLKISLNVIHASDLEEYGI